ncbi:MAG: flagellar brake protein [Roseburia sp.]
MKNNIIKPGDKIDIRLMQQIEQSDRSNTEIRVYKSQVYDVYEDGELEISMPTEGGKIILLPLGVRFEFVFYSNGGLYRAEGTVKERFKRDNLFVLVIEMRSQLEKFQRREYFRLECTLDMKYYKITEDDVKNKTAEEIFDIIRSEQNIYEIEKAGTVVDISGGGMRFISEEENQAGSNILVAVRLVGEKMNKQFYLLGKVISSKHVSTEVKKFENRVHFILKDSKVREEIVRYIFDEERRMRSRK